MKNDAVVRWIYSNVKIKKTNAGQYEKPGVKTNGLNMYKRLCTAKFEFRLHTTYQHLIGRGFNQFTNICISMIYTKIN
jgi:hypothetical protein